MSTSDLRFICGQLPSSEPVIAELFDALIDYIGKLEQRIEVLERVREYTERK